MGCVGYVEQRFSTCGPRTSGGPRPFALVVRELSLVFKLFKFYLAIEITKFNGEIDLFTYCSHIWTYEDGYLSI